MASVATWPVLGPVFFLLGAPTRLSYPATPGTAAL